MHARQARTRAGSAYKTKGHRVIAMPFCSTGLAPPAFTAPCRNQTGDSVMTMARRVPACDCEKASVSAAQLASIANEFVVPLTKLSDGAIFRKTCHHFRERRIATVAIGQQRLFHSPADREGGIVPRDPELRGRIVDLRALVFDVGKHA